MVELPCRDRSSFRETLDRLAAAESEPSPASSWRRCSAGAWFRSGSPASSVASRSAVATSKAGASSADSPSTAELVRPARLAERRRYLDLFPLLRLIVCRRDGHQWLAIPAHRADTRFQIEGMIPVRLIEEAQLFEVIQVRFDGAQCWYDGPDPRRDPGIGGLSARGARRGWSRPKQLNRPGLTAEERAAYALQLLPRLRGRDARPGAIASRSGSARRWLTPAPRFREYQERGDVYRVTYEVDGRRTSRSSSRRPLRAGGRHLPERRGPPLRPAEPGGRRFREGRLVHVGHGIAAGGLRRGRPRDPCDECVTLWHDPESRRWRQVSS